MRFKIACRVNWITYEQEVWWIRACSDVSLVEILYFLILLLNNVNCQSVSLQLHSLYCTIAIFKICKSIQMHFFYEIIRWSRGMRRRLRFGNTNCIHLSYFLHEIESHITIFIQNTVVNWPTCRVRLLFSSFLRSRTCNYDTTNSVHWFVQRNCEPYTIRSSQGDVSFHCTILS